MTTTRADKIKVNFDFLHGEQGGISALLDMVERGEKLGTMSEQFEISETRLSVIIKDILGMPYTEYLIKKGLSYVKRD